MMMMMMRIIMRMKSWTPSLVATPCAAGDVVHSANRGAVGEPWCFSRLSAVAPFAFQLSRPIFFLAMYLWSWGPQVCVTVWGSLEDGKGLIQLLLVACLLTQQGPDVLKFYTVLCQLLFVRGSKLSWAAGCQLLLGGNPSTRWLSQVFVKMFPSFSPPNMVHHGPSICHKFILANEGPLGGGFTGVRPWVRSKVLLVALAIRSPLDLLVGAPW